MPRIDGSSAATRSKSLTLYVGMDGMLENVFINVKNHSETIRLGRE